MNNNESQNKKITKNENVEIENKNGENIITLVCFILVLFSTVAILGFIIQYTWNITLPEIFGVKEITLYQAIGLFVLTGLLFRK